MPFLPRSERMSETASTVMEAASIVDEMCREREQEKRGEQSSDRNMGAEDQIAGGLS